MDFEAIKDYKFKDTPLYDKLKALKTVNGWRAMLQLCSSLSSHVPIEEDPPMKKAFKAAGMADIVIANLKPTRSLIQKYIDDNKLIQKYDPAFVNVFHNSGLKDLFTTDHISLSKSKDKTEYIYHYIHDDFGHIYFNSLNTTHGSNGFGYFWYVDDFDFNGIISKFWDVFENGINVEIKRDQIKYTPIPLSELPFSGYAEAKAKKLAEKHIKYKEHKVPRVTMFVGPPGIGKSTLVYKMAEHITDRIIRIEAESLASMNAADMMFLIGGLKPGCLIVDDVDRISFNSGLSTMFTVLDWMKTEFPDVPMFMTANRVSHLDSAFMRPGRVDEVEWCGLPGKKNRLAILNTYLKHYTVPTIETKDKFKIIKATEGLAIAWIKEIALQLRYESVGRVLSLITSMKQLNGDLKFSYGEEDEENYHEPVESDDDFELEDDINWDEYEEEEEEEDKDKCMAELVLDADEEEDDTMNEAPEEAA